MSALTLLCDVQISVDVVSITGSENIANAGAGSIAAAAMTGSRGWLRSCGREDELSPASVHRLVGTV